uniref:DUF834 domain-containing protein n=1 Tax=Leersia perrieri TaxID=77586 RepID=A0A0D9VS09_9ORYZ
MARVRRGKRYGGAGEEAAWGGGAAGKCGGASIWAGPARLGTLLGKRREIGGEGWGRKTGMERVALGRRVDEGEPNDLLLLTETLAGGCGGWERMGVDAWSCFGGGLV